MTSTVENRIAPRGSSRNRPRPYSRILVPLDGTPFAEAALRPATNIASRSGGSVEIVTVPEPGAGRVATFDPVPPAQAYALEETAVLESYLRRWRDRLREECDCPVHYEVLPDMHPADALTAYARRTGADLTVAATHSRSLLAQLLMGSTAAELVRSAPCPVLLVPSKEPKPDPAATPLHEPPRSLAVALEAPGDVDDVLLGHALLLARMWDATAHVVQLVSASAGPTRISPIEPPVMPPLDEPDRNRIERRAKDRVAAVVAELRQRGAAASGRIVPAGIHPSNSLAEFAQSVEADILLVGRHDRSLLDRILFGSRADRLARNVHSLALMICPVPGVGTAH